MPWNNTHHTWFPRLNWRGPCSQNRTMFERIHTFWKKRTVAYKWTNVNASKHNIIFDHTSNFWQYQSKLEHSTTKQFIKIITWLKAQTAKTKSSPDLFFLLSTQFYTARHRLLQERHKKDSPDTYLLCFEKEIVEGIHVDIGSSGASSQKACPLPGSTTNIL